MSSGLAIERARFGLEVGRTTHPQDVQPPPTHVAHEGMAVMLDWLELLEHHFAPDVQKSQTPDCSRGRETPQRISKGLRA